MEASIRQTLGSVYTELGDYPKAAQQYEGALRLQREHLGESHPDTLRSLYGLVIARWWNGDIAQAEPLTRQGLELSRRALGEKNPLTLQFMQARAFVMMILGEMPWTELEPFFLQAVALHREVLGPDDLGTLKLIQGLSNGPLTAEALRQIRSLADFNDLYLPLQLSELGWAYLEQGQVAKADTLCDLGLQAMRRKPDANLVVLPRVITQLGAVRLAEEEYSEAEALLRESSRLAEKRWPDAAYRYYVMSLLGASLAGQKNYADAEPLLLQSCQGLQQRQASLPPYLNAPRRITESLERLVQLYDAWGKPAQAAEWKQKLATFQQAAQAAEKKVAQP